MIQPMRISHHYKAPRYTEPIWNEDLNPDDSDDEESDEEQPVEQPPQRPPETSRVRRNPPRTARQRSTQAMQNENRSRKSGHVKRSDREYAKQLYKESEASKDKLFIIKKKEPNQQLVLRCFAFFI